MFQYLPIENEACPPGGGRAFGLRVLRAGEEREEELMILPGISTNYGFVLHLAGLCTKKQLDPFRLLDLMESLL